MLIFAYASPLDERSFAVSGVPKRINDTSSFDSANIWTQCINMNEIIFYTLLSYQLVLVVMATKATEHVLNGWTSE